MKIGDVFFEKHTIVKMSSRNPEQWAEADVEEVDAIEIPKNATNGDVIKALFPNPTENTQYTVGEDRVHSAPNGEMHYYSISKSMQFICSTDYWNAPYKENRE